MMTSDGSSNSRIGIDEEGEEEKKQHIPHEDTVYIPTPSRSNRNNGQKIFRSLFNELDDIADFIISIGNEITINAHKQKLCADKYRNGGSGLSNPEDQNKKRGSINDGLRDVLFHAEDVALYSHGLHAVNYEEINIQKSRKKRKVTVSNNETLASPCANYQIFSWPIKHCTIKEKNFRHDDRNWNKFYSDLNFLNFDDDFEKDFVESRSRKHSLVEQKHIHDYTGCSIRHRKNVLGGMGKSDKMENEVLPTFVEKCWEIACGIASNTLELRRSIHNDKSVSDRSQQIKSVKALKALGIQIDPIVFHYEERKGKFYFCQCCHKNMNFTNRANILLHLFGSKESQGCCWKLIKNRQEEKIKAVLQNEAMKILDSLLHLLFEYIESSQSSPENSTQTFLTWVDVNNVTSQISKKTNLSKEQNQATGIELTPSTIDPKSTLSFLNDETVLPARGRLFRRYGK